MKTYRFLREALQEYEDAVAYCEEVRPGLGERFVAEFERTLAVALEIPKAGALVQNTPETLEIRRR